MATLYITQSGAGDNSGSSLANAIPVGSLSWGSYTDDTLIFDGTFTSAVTMGAHNSITQLTLQGQNDCTFTNGFTVTGNSNRNNCRFEDMTFENPGGNGFRLQSGVGMKNFYFLRCNFNNSNNGFSLQCGIGDDLTDLTFDTCDFSNNTTYGRQAIWAGNSPGPASDFSITNWIDVDCTCHLNGRDGFRDTVEAGNQVATINNKQYIRCKGYNNGMNGGGRFVRFGAATHLHNTGEGLICTDCVAIGNGEEYAGGGLDLRSGANNAGSIGDSDVTYIARNIACGNGGENGGINIYGVNNLLVERCITNDQFVGEDNNNDGNTNDPVIDGNGFIIDANSDNIECRYMYASRNKGSSANNSGCGMMILYNLDTVRAHHIYGYGNKTGVWSAHQAGQTQSDIEVWNCTFLDCESWGYSHRGSTAEENTLRNSVFTAAASGLIGMQNTDGGANVDEDYNCFYGFASDHSGNGGLGSNTIVTQPTFDASPTYTDDFSGTDGTELDTQGNITWTIDSADGEGVKGERVINVDGSGRIYTDNDGSGNSGVQTMYLAPTIESPVIPGVDDWDHYVKLTIDSGWTGTVLNGIYGLMRYTDKDNCIIMRLFGTGAGGLVVRKRVDGVETTLISAQPTAGSEYEMRAYTETIELFKDGVSQGTARVLASELDPLAAQGGLGAFQNQSGVQWSNFEFGVLNPGFTPASGSVVLGEGTDSSYTTDSDGSAHSSPPDMGAFQREGTTPPVPTLSSGSAGSITSDGVTPAVDTDVDDGTIYMVVGPENENFWRSDIVNGTLRDGSPALAAENMTVSATGTQTFSAVTGLDSSTNYRIAFVHDSAAGERSLQLRVDFATTAASAPTLTSPTAASVTTSNVEPQVTTDQDNGTLYMVLVPDGDAPSVAQIKAGQQSDSSAAIASESISVSASGAQSFTTVSGLTDNTSYELYFVHTNSDTVDSTASTVGFTTDEDVAPPPAGIISPEDRMGQRKRRRIRWRYRYRTRR